MTSADDGRNKLERIAHRAAPDAHVRQTRKLAGGVSANIYAIEISDREGSTRTLVVREHETTPTEFALLRTLHDLGFAVPMVHHLDAARTILQKPYLVMEFVEGSTVVDDASVASATSQMVQFLTDLHDLKLDAVALPRLTDDDNPVTGALKHLPPTPENAEVRGVLKGRGPWTSKNHARLLHGDFWPGNMLWEDGQLVAVIDWEDASIGDPLSDLAGSRVELLTQYGEETMHQLTNEYLSQSHLYTEDLAVWDLYASSAALAYMGEWGLEPAEVLHRRSTTSKLLEDAKHRITDDLA